MKVVLCMVKEPFQLTLYLDIKTNMNDKCHSIALSKAPHNDTF